jgi:hypothetical protein
VSDFLQPTRRETLAICNVITDNGRLLVDVFRHEDGTWSYSVGGLLGEGNGAVDCLRKLADLLAEVNAP